MLVAVFAVVLFAGAYVNYLKAQRPGLISDMLPDRIDAMAVDPFGGETGIFWGNCFGDGQTCSVVCPKCKAIHYTDNIGYGIITGGYCDNCLHVYPK